MPTVTLNLPETTFVSSALPNSNFLIYPLIYVGTDPSFYGCTGLINVTLPVLPKSVVSAMLQLSVIVKSGASPSTVAVSQLSADFSAKTVTYNSMPSLISTATQFSVAAKDLYTSIQADITDVVNAWLSGAAVNHGIALTVSDGTIVQFGTNNIIYEPYFPKLILTYSSTPVPTGQPYGYVYNTDSQSVAREDPILFTDSGPMDHVTHDAGSDSVVVQSAGLYAVWYRVTGTGANQFAVFQNEAVLLNSIYGTPVANNTGMTMVNAAANDVITLRNHTSGGSVTLDSKAGGSEFSVSASLTLLKVGPNATPNPLLTGVNAAQDTAAMLTAIQNPALGLDLSTFNQLSTNQQQYVLGALIANRPTLGYLTVPDVQAMVNYLVAYAQTNVPDLNSIYVMAGAVGGNGSIALPFGDIQTGIDAVNPGGTVHVLGGTYTPSSTIQINSNITLIGISGQSILDLTLTLNVGLKVSADGVVVSGLTFNAANYNAPTIMQMLEVEGSNCTIMKNTFNGTHVVQSAIEITADQTALVISQNQIHDVAFGIKVQANTQCGIHYNNIYTSGYGIWIQTNFAQIDGNFWTGGSANMQDIALDSSVAGSYDQAALSAQNNGATIFVV